LDRLVQCVTVGGLAAIVMQCQTAAAAVDMLVEIEALVESKTPTGAEARRT